MPWKTALPRRPDTHALRGWLISTGSLTARLARAFPGLHVRLLRQGAGVAGADERECLGLRRSQRAGVREVLLCDARGPLVFAHSIWRLAARDAAWRLIRGLGRRPLGHLLFVEPHVTRSPLEFLRIDARHALHRRAAAAVGRDLPPLWARRSLFMLRGRRLLVTEVFLPAVESAA